MTLKNILFLSLLTFFSLQSVKAETNLSCKFLFSSENYIAVHPSFAFSKEEPENITHEKLANSEYFNNVQSPNDSNFKYVTSRYNTKYRTTILYHKRDGRFRDSTQARFLLLHGYGTTGSRATAMAITLRILTEKFNPYIKTSSTIRSLRTQNQLLDTAAEAIDLPGSGDGPDLSFFKTNDQVVEWLASYIFEMKLQTPNVPIFILTRSSSALFGAALAKKYPALVNGIILMSPTLPGNAEILRHGIQKVKELANLGYYTLNEPALDWAHQMLLAEQWDDNYFTNTPTYIMTGSLDPEMTDYERQIYSGFAKSHSNIQYRDFAGASHNVLETNDAKSSGGLGAYISILEFAKRYL